MTDDDIPVVAASEQDLLLVAQALIAPHATDVWATLCRTRKLPPAISETCEVVLGDTLALVWPALWRRGGTEPGASIENSATKRGRIWERHQPIALEFSPATMRLLRWLVTTQFTAAISTMDKLAATPLTIGDQVMIYFALDASVGTPAQAAIAAQPLVRAAPLAWLGFADLLAEAALPQTGFDSLTHGAGAVVVEALAGDIARHWQAVELVKRTIEAPAALIALGAAQDATLGGFMTACDKRRRRDLACFVIDAAAPLIARGLSPMPTRLDPTAMMSARAAARVAAGALLRAVTTWSTWDQQHRGVRFIDDDYSAAQLLLAKFERIQAAGVERVNVWLYELASLAPTTAPTSTATVDSP